jgi:hypothetical protein
MRKNDEQDNVKMNLTLPKDFYGLLQQNSKSDFMKTATWVKQFLMKHLLGEHKTKTDGGIDDGQKCN